MTNRAMIEELRADHGFLVRRAEVADELERITQANEALKTIVRTDAAELERLTQMIADLEREHDAAKGWINSLCRLLKAAEEDNKRQRQVLGDIVAVVFRDGGQKALTYETLEAAAYAAMSVVAGLFAVESENERLKREIDGIKHPF